MSTTTTATATIATTTTFTTATTTIITTLLSDNIMNHEALNTIIDELDLYHLFTIEALESIFTKINEFINTNPSAKHRFVFLLEESMTKYQDLFKSILFAIKNDYELTKLRDMISPQFNFWTLESERYCDLQHHYKFDPDILPVSEYYRQKIKAYVHHTFNGVLTKRATK